MAPYIDVTGCKYNKIAVVNLPAGSYIIKLTWDLAQTFHVSIEIRVKTCRQVSHFVIKLYS